MIRQIKRIEITTSIAKISYTFNVENVRSSSITLVNVLSIRIKTIKALKGAVKIIHEIIVIIIITLKEIIVKKNKLE